MKKFVNDIDTMLRRASPASLRRIAGLVTLGPEHKFVRRAGSLRQGRADLRRRQRP